MNFLESLGIMAEYIHLALKKEAVVVIVEKETGLITKYLVGETVDIGYREGDVVKESDNNLQAALAGRQSDIYLESNVYGMPLNAYAFPIRQDGKVIGALGFGKPLDKEKQLEAYIESVRQIALNLQSQSHTMAAHSEELSAASTEISTQSEKALEDSKKTNEITNLIKDISRQTNLLGLNASIEAARAGQHGAGFNIVAQEIRKLSQQTNDSTQSIEASLDNIQENLTGLLESINHISKASDREAQLAQDMGTYIESLDDITVNLANFMKEVF